jgi:hypothetical protein
MWLLDRIMGWVSLVAHDGRPWRCNGGAEFGSRSEKVPRMELEAGLFGARTRTGARADRTNIGSAPEMHLIPF